MFADNHHNKVDQPKDKSQTDQTDNARNDLALGKSRNRAKDPCRKRYDCTDDAHDVGQTEIIAFLCHFNTLLT